MNGRAMISALPYAVGRVIKDEIYRVYITDALRLIGKNVAELSGGGYLSNRYYDIIRTDQTEEEKTGDEIAAGVIASICGGDDE